MEKRGYETKYSSEIFSDGNLDEYREDISAFFKDQMIISMKDVSLLRRFQIEEYNMESGAKRSLCNYLNNKGFKLFNQPKDDYYAILRK